MKILCYNQKMIFSIFHKKEQNKSSSQSPQDKNSNLQKISELQIFLDSLLNKNAYIARSDYLKTLQSYSETVLYFQNLKNDELLEDFCRKNHSRLEDVFSVLEKYENVKTLVKNHNENFIQNSLQSEKLYLDSILHDVDPKIILDDDQRRVVLTDEDYCLVIAGAGAGKTTTVAAKVKYLVEKKNIRPEKILVVSFTNKAVDELKEKIQKQLKINCPITTFHLAKAGRRKQERASWRVQEFGLRDKTLGAIYEK